MANCGNIIKTEGRIFEWYFSSWRLNGITTSNTDNCKLYVLGFVDYEPHVHTTKQKIHLYKQASGGNVALIGQGEIDTGTVWNPYGSGGALGFVQFSARTVQIVERNNSGVSGSCYWSGFMCTGGYTSTSTDGRTIFTPANINNTGTLYFSSPITTTTTPTTTTATTTNPFPTTTTSTTTPDVTTTTTTPSQIPTTTTTTTTENILGTTTTTTTPLDIRTIQYLDNTQIETVTKRSGALNFGTMAPGETSETIIVSLFAPSVKAINNIKLALIDTGGVIFDENLFGITSGANLNFSIVPSSYFIGVNEDDSTTNNYNVVIANRDPNTSDYVYLNLKLPLNNFIGHGVCRLKWYFDYSD